MKKLFLFSTITFVAAVTSIVSLGLVAEHNAPVSNPDASPITSTAPGTSEVVPVADLGTTTSGEYTIVKRQVEKPQYLDASLVAKHTTKPDCWFIISGSVYNVTDYIPFHPGGEGTIIDTCGTDATTAFNTKGGRGQSHSASAKSLLNRYLLGKIGDQWGTVMVEEEVRVPKGNAAAQTVGTPQAGAPVATTPQTPTSGGRFAVGASVVTISEVNVRSEPTTVGLLVGRAGVGVTGKIVSGPKSGSGYTWYNIAYSNELTGWSVQDYLSIAPTGNTVPASTPATTPQTTPQSPSGVTAATVAAHNTSGSCWLIISGKVYDVTAYIPFHPGGQNAIKNVCGTDATTLFNGGGGGHNHSSSARSLLGKYYVGDLAASSPTPVTAVTCTSFTYNSWVSCQPDGTQTRTVKTSSPSGCIGGSPVTSRSCTYTPPVTTGGPYTAAQVATHSSSGNCWLIISGKVYDVTDYIPFHPGGQNAIKNVCGTDATTLFTTSAGHVHSSSAHALLSQYYVGDYSASLTTATCTSFTYSSWGSCQPSGTQTRTVNSSSPSGCTGGSPVTSQSCTYTPPTTSGGPYTVAQVASHSSSGSCWLIISDKVYDVTAYIPFHPGGQNRIISRCGTDSTSAFLTSSAGHAHSQSAKNLLAGYYIGDLDTGTTPPPDPNPTTCTSFTYNSWGACQPDGTQTRTVRTSSPAGCTGGNPVTSQSCTYVPGGQTYTVNVDSSGDFDQTSIDLTAGDYIKFTYTSGGGEAKVQFSPSTISGFTVDSEKKTKTVQFTTSGTWSVTVGDKSGNTLTVTVE